MHVKTIRQDLPSNRLFRFAIQSIPWAEGLLSRLDPSIDLCHRGVCLGARLAVVTWWLFLVRKVVSY